VKNDWDSTSTSIRRARIAPVAFRWLVVVLLSIALPGLLSVAPAVARSPQPVLPIDLFEPAPDDEDQPAEEEPQDEPQTGCGDEAGSGTRVVASRGHGGSFQAAFPGPVIPVQTVGAPTSACDTQVQLTLNIEAPNGQRPMGIGATLAGSSISQSALEGGYEVRLPADSYDIALAKPPPEWELVETFCTCTEAARTASLRIRSASFAFGSPMLTSFPSPVVPVDSVPVAGFPCGGATASSGATANASASTTAASAMTDHSTTAVLGVASVRGSSPAVLTMVPRPVLPVGPSGIDVDSLGDDKRPASISWTSGGEIRITDHDRAGGVFLCEWTVRWAFGDLAIETVTDPAGKEGGFSYRVTPNFSDPPTSAISLAGSPPPGDRAEIRKGSWSVSLMGLRDGWAVKRSTCTETDSTTTSSAAGESATIRMDSGDEVRCRFDLELLALRQGRWRADNRPARFRCEGGLSLPIKRDVQSSRLTLRNGGDTLVARGLSAGSGTVRLSRDPDDPLHYSGSVRIPGARGAFRFTIDVTVKDAETATAKLRATIRSQGRRCTINRTVRLSYSGG
jgi:hypothetical protein